MSGILAAGGLLDTMFGTITGKLQADVARENTNKTIKAQLQQQEKQNEYNYRMWQEQNAYNTPSAQMERLEAAGLNPNLVYGSGSVVGNAAEHAPKSATADINYNYAAPQIPQMLNVLSFFQDFRQKSANIKQTEVLTNSILKKTEHEIWKQRLTELNHQFGQSSFLDRLIREEYKTLNERGLLRLRENQLDYQTKETSDYLRYGVPRGTPFLQRTIMSNPNALDNFVDVLIKNFTNLFRRGMNNRFKF